jgi:purine-binding chemotaxis protein CheW
MPEETQARQLVILTLGAEQYALPIKQVREIIRYRAPRLVASTEPSVRGVLSLRGRIVPIHDLAGRLGVTSELSEQTRIVIVDTGSDTVGVIVDAVDEVLTIEGGEIKEVPGVDTTLIDSIAKFGERIVGLLNPSTIFASTTTAA